MGQNQSNYAVDLPPAYQQASSHNPRDKSAPPSYSASLRIKAGDVHWTYDAVRGFWMTLDVPGCQVIGFGNDDGKLPYPEFFVACTLEHAIEPHWPESERVRVRAHRSKTLTRAAECLARHRRKYGCDCDFEGFRRWSWQNDGRLEAPSTEGPINIYQRKPRVCLAKGWRGFLEQLGNHYVYFRHADSCDTDCMAERSGRIGS